MSVRLRYLPMQEIEAGMVLGHQLVLSERGVAVLNLPEGHVLTEANLAQLRARHAEYACIAAADTRSEAERQQLRQEQEARLRSIFRNADLEQAATRGLFDAVLAYRSA